MVVAKSRRGDLRESVEEDVAVDVGDVVAEGVLDVEEDSHRRRHVGRETSVLFFLGDADGAGNGSASNCCLPAFINACALWSSYGTDFNLVQIWSRIANLGIFGRFFFIRKLHKKILN